MRKTMISLFILLVALQFGAIGVAANVDVIDYFKKISDTRESTSTSETYPYPATFYEYKIILPNGYLAYFQEVNHKEGPRATPFGYVSGVYDSSIPRKLICPIEYGFTDALNNTNYVFSLTGEQYVKFASNLFPGCLPPIENKQVLTFYEKGQETQKYTIINPKTLQDGTPAPPRYNFLSAHDLINDTLYLDAIDGQYYMFDLRTGDISHQSDSPRGEINVGDMVIIVEEAKSCILTHIDVKAQIPLWLKMHPHTVSKIQGDYILLDIREDMSIWVSKKWVLPYIQLAQT